MNITQQQAHELYEIGSKMRKAQRIYFLTRSYKALDESKDYERRFDAILEQIITGIKQQKLF
jgi:hypothetical protein